MVAAPVIDYVGSAAIVARQTATLVKIVIRTRATPASVRLFGWTSPSCVLMATRALITTLTCALLLIIAILIIIVALREGKATECQRGGGEG